MIVEPWTPTLGAIPIGEGRCRFRVWAPNATSMEVHVVAPRDRHIPMVATKGGYFEAVDEAIEIGTQYMFRIDCQRERPDPASRYQPEGVHGPSEVIHPRFAWSDAAWRGVPLSRAIFYELHVGAYTEQGTFEAIIDRLDDLRDLGITMIELMPVAQFPGDRNWGYDGVCPFAVQDSYGGSTQLKRLVNACHERGLGVTMDVVYNHLGPEGNYLEDFGPYFTEKYTTPWGKALNFDDAWCDGVRQYFVENALMWVSEFHIDALRLDAVHAIFDQSAYPFLHELTDAVHDLAERLGRHVLVIGESDLNDPKLIRPPEAGGWGMDATWSDDFHHSIHALLTGERQGYYSDFGTLQHLSRALREGYVYSGTYSNHRRRKHGAPASDVPPERHVVCSQNHDQVGNRMNGDRLSALLSFEKLKLAAVLVLLSPFTPLLFMGEEYAERAPFLYFVSHSDPALVEAVRKGRSEEFASFNWKGHPPDPQSPDTFERSKLDWTLRDQGQGRTMLAFYQELIRLRTDRPAIRSQRYLTQTLFEDSHEKTLMLLRASDDSEEAVLLAMNFGDAPHHLTIPECGNGAWQKLIDSSDERWGGKGGGCDSARSTTSFTIHPFSAVVFERTLARNNAT